MMHAQRLSAVRALLLAHIALSLAGAARGQSGGPSERAADSIRFGILRIAVREAELEADRTDFWRRIFPRVEVSAAFSARSLLFADPDASAGYLLPRDSYRLSAGLRLNDLIDGTEHERALLALGRRRLELALAAAEHAEGLRKRMAADARRDTLRAMRDELLALRAEGVSYHELLFREGKIAFDALLRSRLSHLGARMSRLINGDPSGMPPEAE